MLKTVDFPDFNPLLHRIEMRPIQNRRPLKQGFKQANILPATILELKSRLLTKKWNRLYIVMEDVNSFLSAADVIVHADNLKESVRKEEMFLDQVHSVVHSTRVQVEYEHIKINHTFIYVYKQ